jgi:pimeloyl-ACP methyl ester carboxylesterase
VAGPLESLQALARQEVRIAGGPRHLEIFTMAGLLTVLWHGDADAEDVVVACGGAMGGLLGPAGGLYQWLGEHLAEAGSGVGVLRVSWRRPNDLGLCTLDLLAAADLAARAGARRFVTMGHSFGGAAAIGAGAAMGESTAGVVTFATQSAGCESASELGAPLLLFHGDRDELLPVFASEVVQHLAGGDAAAELVVCRGAGHLLVEAADVLREQVPVWISRRFDEHRGTIRG